MLYFEITKSSQVDPSPSASPTSSYIVLLSGTHITGKETLAVSLPPRGSPYPMHRDSSCPWIKSEMAHNAAMVFGSRSKAKRGLRLRKSLCGRIWFSKLRRLGFLTDGSKSDGRVRGATHHPDEYRAVISLYLSHAQACSTRYPGCLCGRTRSGRYSSLCTSR